MAAEICIRTYRNLINFDGFIIIELICTAQTYRTLLTFICVSGEIFLNDTSYRFTIKIVLKSIYSIYIFIALSIS